MEKYFELSPIKVAAKNICDPGNFWSPIHVQGLAYTLRFEQPYPSFRFTGEELITVKEWCAWSELG